MSSASLLNAIAPQFDSNVNRNTFLELAAMQTSQNWYGTKYDYAVALLAAHLLTLNTDSSLISGAGPITSKREGDLSVSYAAPSSNKIIYDYYLQTTYGKQLLQLKKQGGFFLGVTGGNDLGY